MMQKNYIKYLIFTCCLFVTHPVYASTNILAKDCSSVFDPEVIKFLQQIFNVFKFAAPVLVLVYSTLDFVKAATSQDKEALQKAAKTALKRVLLAMLLFVIPELINFLFDKLKMSGTCGIK